MLGLGVGLTTNRYLWQQIRNKYKIGLKQDIIQELMAEISIIMEKKCLPFGFVGSLKCSFSVIGSVFLTSNS